MKRFSDTTKIALGSALMLALAIGCGDSKPVNQEAEIDVPSMLDEPKEEKQLSAVQPVTAPVVEPMNEPEPVAPKEPERPLPNSFKGFIAEGKHIGKSDIDGALDMFARARAMGKHSALPDIEAARVLISAGRIADARSFAEAAVEADEESSYAWNTMGRVALASGELEEAEVAFTKATETNEDNSYAWNNLGLVHIRLGNHEQAVTALEHATSGESPKAYMWNNLGMSYEHLDKLELARAAYRQARDLGSSKAEASLERLKGVKSIVVPEDSETEDVEEVEDTN